MKTTDFINENFVADAAAAHQDHEVQMARGDCYNAAKYAIELHKLLKNISEQEGLEGWVSEKITLANDYLRTVTEYLRYEQQTSSQSDMPDFNIGTATQTLDAALGEGIMDIFKGDTKPKKPAPRMVDEPGKVSFSDLGKNSMFDPTDKRNTDDQRAFYEFMLSQKNKSDQTDFVNILQHYLRKYKEAARKEGGSNSHNSGRLKVLTYLDAKNQYSDTWNNLASPKASAKPAVAEDDYDDAVAAFLAKNKPTQGKTHKPRAAERLGGSKHIGAAGGKGTSKGKVSGLGANTHAGTKPVVTAEEKVRLDPKCWKGKHKEGTKMKGGVRVNNCVPNESVEEAKADPVGSWVVYDGGKVKRFKSRDGAKAYAEKNGGKVASSEHYADNIQGKQGVAEGIRVIDQDYDLDQVILTLDIEGRRVSFTYTDYNEDFDNAERGDVFEQLMRKDWYKGLDHPTRMEILDAAYRAIRGLEPQPYQPTVGDEPMDVGDRLDEQGVAEGSTWYAGNGAIKEKIAKYEELALKANREGDDAKTKMYQQKIQTLKQKMSHMEESAGSMGAASVATSMGGGNGFANGGPGTISRPKMKKKK